MNTIQKRILIAGISIKLNRGEDLEEILASYVNLTEEYKQEIKDSL